MNKLDIIQEALINIMNWWSLYIDIEGFSNMFRTDETKVLKLLSDLMGDLYKIGTRIYSDEFNRLFIHQIADGFIIYSHFGDLGLVRPISIAIALMQSTALRGGSCQAI